MRSLFALLGVSTLGVIGSYAQPAPVIQILRETIKEGQLAPHERTEGEYVRAFRKAKYPGYYVALSSMSGPNEVLFISPMESFAMQEELQKATEKEPLKSEIETAESHDGALRESSRSMWAVFRPDLSYRAEAFVPGKAHYVSIATYRLRFGKEEDFMKGAASVIAAYKKGAIPAMFLGYQVVAGAPAGTFLFIEPLTTLKTLDEMPARQKAFRDAMGADALKQLMSGSNELFAYMDNHLYSVSPKMSYVSSKTEDADPAFWRPRAPAAPKPKEKAAK